SWGQPSGGFARRPKPKARRRRRGRTATLPPPLPTTPKAPQKKAAARASSSTSARASGSPKGIPGWRRGLALSSEAGRFSAEEGARDRVEDRDRSKHNQARDRVDEGDGGRERVGRCAREIAARDPA